MLELEEVPELLEVVLEVALAVVLEPLELLTGSARPTASATAARAEWRIDGGAAGGSRGHVAS